jgi:hypothetical protein
LNTQGGFASWAPSISIPARGTAVLGILTTTVARTVQPGWNLVSLPLDVQDPLVSAVYPTASSPAYSYSTLTGYEATDTCRMGDGYWLKFPAGQVVNVAGGLVRRDTIAVERGWNIVGSLSSPFSVADVLSDPPGIISSDFFGYHAGGSYAIADSITPGGAYWVKMGQVGRLILASPPAAAKVRK